MSIKPTESEFIRLLKELVKVAYIDALTKYADLQISDEEFVGLADDYLYRTF